MSPTNFRGSKSASRDKTGATDQRGDVAEALSHSGVAASHSIAHVIPVVERFAARALLMIGCVFLRESASCSRLDASSFEQVPVARDWTRLPTSKCQLLAIGRVFLRASAGCSRLDASSYEHLSFAHKSLHPIRICPVCSCSSFPLAGSTRLCQYGWDRTLTPRAVSDVFAAPIPVAVCLLIKWHLIKYPPRTANKALHLNNLRLA